MRIRPVWQTLLAIFAFLFLQRQMQSLTPFKLDPILIKAFFLYHLALLPLWLIFTAFLCVAVFFLERAGDRAVEFARSVASDRDSKESHATKNWIWLLAGIVFLICILIQLEHQRSFFFTQDDNLMQFLPVILQGGRSFFSGTFPTWNPYQFLGAPTTSLGVYALTYPFTYISYALARFIFHNELWTIEIYCIFHIFAGYFSFYWAARCYRVRASIAVMAALCTVLSGWFLIASPSWFYVSPIFVYVPLMIVAVAKLQGGMQGWKWIVGLAVVIGLFFHAGNVQFWVYGMMFLWVAFLVLKCAGLIDWRQSLSAVAATVLGIALVCPLLIPQFLQTHDTTRVMSPATGEIVGQWIAALIPGPWVNAYAPANSLEPSWKTGGLILYSGSTFALFFIFLLPIFLFYKFDRKTIGRNVWAICAAIAWLASMGLNGIVWTIMVHSPLLSKFRIPIKFIAFFDVFVVLAGALVSERILSRTKWHRLFAGIVIAATSVLLILSTAMRLPTWYTYPIRPYPAADFLLEKMPDAKMLHQRMMSLALMRSPAADYWQAMPHNLPTIYKVPALTGYDPLVDHSPTFSRVEEGMKAHLLQSLQEYGAEYILLPNDFDNPRTSGSGVYAPMEKYPPVPREEVPKMFAESKELFHNQELSILQIPSIKPLAFVEGAPAALPLKVKGNGFDIDVTSVSGRRIIANFLWYPQMQATVDGQTVKVESDSWQRMAIDIPAGAKIVRVRYVPEWGKGLLCAVLVTLLGLACGFFALRPSLSAAGARTVSR